MVTWNPSQYLLFGNERLRPALDLLARIAIQSPASVYDLGCGPGTATALLKDRWPRAQVTGIDASSEMLDRARALRSDIAWEAADLNAWHAQRPADVLYSNAALHWLDGHPVLFPHLLDSLRPGGVFAVQMPQNFSALTHTAIGEVIRGGPWQQRLEPHFRAHPTLDTMEYYHILRPHVSVIDIWETNYYHILEGKDPIVEWTKGTSLRPVLTQMSAEETSVFLERYASLLRSAYPPQSDGTTILPFKRLFIIAQR